MIMTENMQIAITAINKWLYFGWNYEIIHHKWNSTNGEQKEEWLPAFLVKAQWTCNFDHMLDKWNKVTQSGNTNSYLTQFYAELDTTNCKILLEWIMQNYQGEKKLFY